MRLAKCAPPALVIVITGRDLRIRCIGLSLWLEPIRTFRRRKRCARKRLSSQGADQACFQLHGRGQQRCIQISAKAELIIHSWRWGGAHLHFPRKRWLKAGLDNWIQLFLTQTEDRRKRVTQVRPPPTCAARTGIDQPIHAELLSHLNGGGRSQRPLRSPWH